MSNILDVLREQKEIKLKGNIYHITKIKFAYNNNGIADKELTEEITKEIHKILKSRNIR